MKKLILALALIAPAAFLAGCDVPQDPTYGCENNGGLSGHVSEGIDVEREHHSKGGYHTYERPYVAIYCKDNTSYTLWRGPEYEVDDNDRLDDDGVWHDEKTVDEVGQ